MVSDFRPFAIILSVRVPVDAVEAGTLIDPPAYAGAEVFARVRVAMAVIAERAHFAPPAFLIAFRAISIAIDIPLSVAKGASFSAHNSIAAKAS